MTMRTLIHFRYRIFSDLQLARNVFDIFCVVDNFSLRLTDLQVQHSRMKGKQVTLAHAQQLFAQDRETVLVSAFRCG